MRRSAINQETVRGQLKTQRDLLFEEFFRNPANTRWQLRFEQSTTASRSYRGILLQGGRAGLREYYFAFWGVTLKARCVGRKLLVLPYTKTNCALHFSARVQRRSHADQI